MKKKFLTLITLIILLATPLFAADIKWYSDWQNGYGGYSGADYLGTTKTVNPREYAEKSAAHIRDLGLNISRYCQKLSKQENFLLWSALKTYNYSDNEVYSVTIQQGKEILQLIAVIIDGGERCNWYGGWYVWEPSIYMHMKNN